MSWLRAGDTVATHPIVLAVLEHTDADDRDVNEVFGFVMRCALQSAANEGDYVISYGTAIAMAGTKSAAERLLGLAEFAGYITRAETLEGRPAFKLHEDPDFIHLRSKDEIEFEQQRDRDRRDQSLTLPVWLRDGDACRYCRRIVSWTDKKSRRRGTFDHLVPGEAATHDTYVVACKGCNSALQDQSHEERSKFLLSAPPRPHYSREGVKYWTDTDWAKEHKDVMPQPTTGSKLKPGDFIPGATKISAFIKDVQERARKARAGDTQSSTEPTPTRGEDESGTTGSQPDEAPAEPNTRGQSGTADRTSARPARDTTVDGQSGRETTESPSPASTTPDGGQSGRETTSPRTAPSAPRPPSTPADEGKQRLRNDSGIIRESADTEGWIIPDCRVGTGRDGPGRAGSGLDGSGLVGSGARQRPDRLPPSAQSRSQRRRNRRKG